MLEMGWAELLLIAIITLFVVGPEKLPEVARSMARLLRQVQRVVSEFREVVNLEEFDTQIRQSSPVVTPTPGVDPELRANRAVENEAMQPAGAGESNRVEGETVDLIGVGGATPERPVQASTLPPQGLPTGSQSPQPPVPSERGGLAPKQPDHNH